MTFTESSIQRPVLPADPGPAAVVHANLHDTQQGQWAAVRARWRDDAVHHILTRNDFAGDVGVDAYLGELCPSFFTAVADTYRFDIPSVVAYGELVVVHWRSRGTLPDGTALHPDGGLLIYRVLDGLVAESWAIPAGAGGTLPF